MKTGKSSCDPSRLKITKCCHKTEPRANMKSAWGLWIAYSDGSSHPYSRNKKGYGTGGHSGKAGRENRTTNIFPTHFTMRKEKRGRSVQSSFFNVSPDLPFLPQILQSFRQIPPDRFPNILPFSNGKTDVAVQDG